MDTAETLARRVSVSLKGRLFRGFPLRREFTFSAREESPSPMVTLMRTSNGKGGRGGRTRLLLYLAAIWIAGTSNSEGLGGFATKRVPAFWAQLLGLDDPNQAGARAIRAARDTLIERGFFLPDPNPRIIRLGMETGNARAYSPPTGRGESGKGYFRVPESFFTSGMGQSISLPAITVYLAALSLVKIDPHSGAQLEPIILRPGPTASTFGIADLSRKKGIKELIERDVFIDTIDPKEQFSSYFGFEGQPRNRSKSLYINPIYLPPLPPLRPTVTLTSPPWAPGEATGARHPGPSRPHAENS